MATASTGYKKNKNLAIKINLLMKFFSGVIAEARAEGMTDDLIKD